MTDFETHDTGTYARLSEAEIKLRQANDRIREQSETINRLTFEISNLETSLKAVRDERHRFECRYTEERQRATALAQELEEIRRNG